MTIKWCVTNYVANVSTDMYICVPTDLNNYMSLLAFLFADLAKFVDGRANGGVWVWGVLLRHCHHHGTFGLQQQQHNLSLDPFLPLSSYRTKQEHYHGD